MSSPICTGSTLRVGIKYTGKVRDTYRVGPLLILVTTDRLSAFDRNLCNVPHKGAVLNLTSAWWMQQTASLCPNALLSVPHPNISVMRACVPFKVEVVVRAYLTGTTGTSVWSHYSKGARTYCGYTLPDGAHPTGTLKTLFYPLTLLFHLSRELHTQKCPT
jgi:phosphoribosylaminoimidazole-succinocarboxamide synthase